MRKYWFEIIWISIISIFFAITIPYFTGALDRPVVYYSVSQDRITKVVIDDEDYAPKKFFELKKYELINVQ